MELEIDARNYEVKQVLRDSLAADNFAALKIFTRSSAPLYEQPYACALLGCCYA